MVVLVPLARRTAITSAVLLPLRVWDFDQLHSNCNPREPGHSVIVFLSVA